MITRAELLSGSARRRHRAGGVFCRHGRLHPARRGARAEGTRRRRRTALRDLATERAQAPVRLVKTIGDAAMLVSNPIRRRWSVPHLGCSRTRNRRSCRACGPGSSCGPALERAGDYFGHSVNLASRVTGVARPGSVLCTQEVHERAGDAFECSFAGRFRLKGVGEPVPLHRARRHETSSADRLREPGEKANATSRPSAGRPRRRASS